MTAYQNPEKTQADVLSLLRKYNVMLPEQAAAFFPGKEKGVFRAIQKLEKNRQLYRNPYTGLIASSEAAYDLRDEGTIQCLWVLADMCRKKKTDMHLLAEHEEYPVRILILSQGQSGIYTLLYVGEKDVSLVNSLYQRREPNKDRQIAVLEREALMEQIQIPGLVGYCVVKEGGEVVYYRKKEESAAG